MANDAMIRSLAKELASLIASIDQESAREHPIKDERPAARIENTVKNEGRQASEKKI